MIATHNSVSLKKLSGDVIDRGGRVIAIDHSAVGEYAIWARSVTDAVIVDVDAPDWSLDPLRLFGPVVGSRTATTFLTPLLNIAPTSDLGVVLSQVLKPSYLAAHGIAGLGTLMQHLLTECELPQAAQLGRRMDVFASKDGLGDVVFKDSLPVLAAAPAVIVRTHTLQLPSREELNSEHLFEFMAVEKMSVGPCMR